ncbi:fumarylacetoacetate hydrolase family protein [Thauera sp.]|uniref:2-keto-4-pentenoate hydratase n=1 Tax=Thauera sp. TaxID=1905334 RepID=UPI00257D6955|nr:fumarylacetoacetate hydrolase family protein [Thauera sp.]
MSVALSPRGAELAERLVAAWRSGQPLSALDATRLAPSDDTAACTVQDAVGAALDWFPRGRARAWKIASAPPTAAPVPDAFLLEGAHRLRHEDFHTVIGIEVELVLRLGRALPAGCSETEAAAAIDGIFAAIEIFDVRARDWNTLPRTFLLADHQMHGRLLLGTGIEQGWQDSLADTEVILIVDGREKLRRHGGHALGSPVAILPWLAGHVAARADGLQKGDLVASGTWTGLHEAHIGERIAARFANIGEVCLDIT